MQSQDVIVEAVEELSAGESTTPLRYLEAGRAAILISPERTPSSSRTSNHDIANLAGHSFIVVPTWDYSLNDVTRFFPRRPDAVP